MSDERGLHGQCSAWRQDNSGDWLGMGPYETRKAADAQSPSCGPEDTSKCAGCSIADPRSNKRMDLSIALVLKEVVCS
jgi:hypothetical protein